MVNKIRIRKVDVEELIIMLEELFHKGVSYVDIVGKIGEGEDRLGLYFTKSYMDEEFADNFESILEEQEEEEKDSCNIKVDLSDEDLNQLI